MKLNWASSSKRYSDEKPSTYVWHNQVLSWRLPKIKNKQISGRAADEILYREGIMSLHVIECMERRNNRMEKKNRPQSQAFYRNYGVFAILKRKVELPNLCQLTIDTRAMIILPRSWYRMMLWKNCEKFPANTRWQAILTPRNYTLSQGKEGREIQGAILIKFLLVPEETDGPSSLKVERYKFRWTITNNRLPIYSVI